MDPTVSIVIPSIRPENLEKVYNSIVNACRLHTFEVIIISPYVNIPEILLKTGNVRLVHSYASPSVCAQIGFSLATGQYIYHFTDDCLAQSDAIDKAIQFIKDNNLNDIAVLNMRYIEDVLNLDLSPKTDSPTPFPDSYWKVKTYPDFYLPGINLEWELAPHFFISRNFLNFLGALDTSFEYINWNLHDFSFRILAYGGTIHQSPFTASLASHLKDTTGDHFAVHYANDTDKMKFQAIYSKPKAVNERIKLRLDNWKSQPAIWERRFDKNNLPIHK